MTSTAHPQDPRSPQTMITLAAVAQIAGASLSDERDAARAISGISLDSTQLAGPAPAAGDPGPIFAALPGTRVHGASYAATAGAAIAIMTDAPGAELLAAAGEQRPVLVVPDIRAVLGPVAAEIYGRPSEDMVVLGVTGTSGKTTTSYLLESGLLAAGYRVGLIGTTGTRINGVAVPTSLTTPEAPTLHALFARMRAEGVSHVVMEVSSHALELGRVAGTRFQVAGFSNLSQDHLDFHPTMEDYFQAKARLFTGPGHAARAVVVIDDDYGRRLAAQLDPQHLSVISTTDAPEWSSAPAAQHIYATARAGDGAGGQHVQLQWRSGTEHQRLEFTLPLPGAFNVANAALALAMAQAAGVPAAEMIPGIAQVAVPGRMERVDRGQDFIALVDYAHKPAAVAAVLDTLRAQRQPGSRIGVVIGAGGDRDAAKRELMGQAAARRADLVVVTDDNPRSEEPAAIRQAVLSGAQRERAAGAAVHLEEIGHRAAAIDYAVRWAQPGDIVIVVGKGHEQGQIIGDKVIDFDDRVELARAIEERGDNAR